MVAVDSQGLSVLFGVLGGGSISGESGTLIKSQLEEIVGSLNNTTNTNQRRIRLSLDTQGTKSAFSAGLKEITSNLSGQKQFKLKIANIDATSAIDNVKKQLQSMLSSLSVSNGVNITGLSDFLGADGISSALKETSAEVDGVITKMDSAKTEAASWAGQMKVLDAIAKSLANTYKSSLSGKNMIADTTSINEITSVYNDWQQKVEATRASRSALSAEELSSLQSEGIGIQQKISLIQSEQAAQSKAAEAAEKKASAEAAASKKEVATLSQVLVLYDKIDSYILNNKNIIGTDQYNQLTNIRAGLSEVASAAQDAGDQLTSMSKTDFNNTKSDVTQLTTTLKEAGKTGKSLWEKLQTAYEKFGGWAFVTRSMMSAVRFFKQMVSAVTEIDTAMTELRKVTNETETTYIRFLENAASRAKTLGATVADTVTATADFSRLGYALDEATTLADSSLIYKNVGDGIEDISDASESLISTMKAFGIEAEDAMSIVDRFNEVGNNFAISSKGVGDALLRSASSLAAANNSLDQSIALVTTANNVIQDPDKVGTALKTVSMYLRAAKTEAEDAGESTDGMAESVSKLRAELLSLTGGKLDIQIDADTFKSTYQIIKELSEVWEELTDISQANILEMIGGKRNSNVVSALLTNFETAEAVIETAANATGSALSENEKVLASIEGKLSVFKATFEDLSTSLIGSDAVKAAIDFGTAILSVCNELAKINMLIPTVIASIVFIKSMKLAQGVNSLVSSLIAEKTAMTSSIATYNALSLAQRKSVALKLQDAVTTGALSKAEYANIAAKLGLATATTGAKVATDGLNISLKALALSNPVGWILTVISLIPMIISLVKGVHKSNEELIQDADDLKTSYNNAFDEISTNLSTLHGVEDEFKKLSAGVDDYGNNISLATDDYKRYQEIVSSILGISPSLISGYNNEGEAIANKNSLLEKSIELMEAEQRLKLQDYFSDDSMGTIVDGMLASLEEKIKAIDFPGSIAFSGVKILDSGELEQGYVNRISDYLEKAIGVEYDFWNDSIPKYIQNNAKLIESNIGAILNNASSNFTDEYGNEWQALSDQQVEDLQNYILSVTNAVDSSSAELNQILQQSPQLLTSYYSLTDEQKDFLARYINNFTIATDTTSEDIIQMKQDILDFTNFIAGNGDLKNVITVGFALQAGKDIDGEDLTVAEYQEQVKDLIEQIGSFDEDVQVKIKAVLGIEAGTDALNEDVSKAIEHAKNLLQDEYGDMVADLSLNDVLDIYYKISAEPNSMTFDGLLEKLEEVRVSWSNYPDVWDFSGLFSDFDTLEGKFSSLVSAMDSLKSGTALTVSELAKLATEYPELLKVSNLFTDTSIKNQKAMLEAVLGTYESEYDALIDTKSAELEATNVLLQSQIELEDNKRQKIVEIADLEANGKLDSEEEYQKILNELKDLEGQNYVTFSDGKLAVNEDMLNGMLTNEGESIEASKPLWESQADMIAEASHEGINEGLKAFPKFIRKIASWTNSSLATTLSGIATNIKKALSGDTDFSVVSAISENLSIGDSGKITLSTKIKDFLSGLTSDNITINGQSVGEWTSDYQELITKRVETLQETIDTNNTILKNLADLKGLDLQSLYGSKNSSSNSSSSKNKEIEEYIAEIDQYRLAIERLNRIQIKRASLETTLSNTDDLHKQIELQKELLDVYVEEQDALHVLNDLRDETIKNGTEALRQYGFEVEYDPDKNNFFIQNLEHINELVADSKGDYETMEEATNALREEIESFIDSLEDLNSANQENSESWWDLQYSVSNAKDAIIDALAEIVSNASEAVDTIQNVYSVLKDAAKEYAESDGFISVDTFQAITELGLEYMQCLEDENGLLVINEENINKVIAAKTEQLAVDAALNYVGQVAMALAEGQTSKLERLLNATNSATASTRGLVYAQAALLDLDSDQYERLISNLNIFFSLADNAIENIGKATGTRLDYYNDASSALDKILSLTMDLIKYEKELEVKALQKQIDDYKEIIELKKKSLQASADEKKYADEVAAKVAKIAKLQSQIDQLSLDDSREAQAQKKALEEELAELQSELADYQADYSLEKQQEALDAEADAFEATKNEEIDIVNDTISSTEKLYRLAIDRISNNWDTLYGDLIAWNYSAGSSIESEIVEAWNLATAAVKEYGSYLAALDAVSAGISASDDSSYSVVGSSSSSSSASSASLISQMKANSLAWWSAGSTSEQSSISSEQTKLASQLASLLGTTLTSKNGVWYTADGSALYSLSSSEIAKAVVSQMKANSAAWSSASTSQRTSLEGENRTLAARLQSYLGQSITADSNGVWWINGKKLYDVYHQGGIVGGQPNLKQNEVMAILEKGEAVLDAQKEASLFKLIDFVSLLSDQIGNSLDTSSLSLGNARLATLGDNAGSMVSNSSTESSFSPILNMNIQIDGSVDQSDATRIGDTIADTAIQKLNAAFAKKGYRDMGDGILKA